MAKVKMPHKRHIGQERVVKVYNPGGINHDALLPLPMPCCRHHHHAACCAAAAATIAFVFIVVVVAAIVALSVAIAAAAFS